MKKNKIILILNAVLLAAVILYSTCALPLNSEKIITEHREQAKLFSASSVQSDTLLNGVPISVPAPAFMQLRNNSIKNCFHSKLFIFSPLGSFGFEKTFLAFYENVQVSNALHPLRLHLTFCVFRI